MPSSCPSVRSTPLACATNSIAHRHVDRGAVEVERVACRHDQADHRLRAPEVLELRHDPRQHGLGRRGAEDDQDLLADVPQELDDAETGRHGDRAEHEEDEDAGTRGRRQPSASRARRATPIPYRPTVNAIAPNAPIGASRMIMPTIANSASDAAGSDSTSGAAGGPILQQRQAEEHREQQHLQHVSARERADDGVGNDIQQELDGPWLSCAAPVYAATALRSAVDGSKPMPLPAAARRRPPGRSRAPAPW